LRDLEFNHGVCSARRERSAPCTVNPGKDRMDMVTLGALFGAAVVNAAMPGPCIVLAAGRAASSGITAGLRVTAGMVVASLMLIGLAWAVMLGTLLFSPDLFDAMRVAGVVVLVVLAIAMMRASPRDAAPRRATRLGDLGGGIAVGLSSPINLVFILALLPQFIDPERASPALFVVSTAVVVAATILPMAAASALGARLGGVAPRGGQWIGRAGGTALLVFAGLAAMSPA
jgi:threonine/homoserine/homoserine lactone efflux protein